MLKRIALLSVSFMVVASPLVAQDKQTPKPPEKPKAVQSQAKQDKTAGQKKAADEKKAKDQQKAADEKKAKDQQKAADAKKVKDQQEAADKKKAEEQQKAADKKKAEEQQKAADKKKAEEQKKAADKKKQQPDKTETTKAPAAKTPTVPKDPRTLPAAFVKSLNWRSIGPSSMGGRIVDLAVVESDPCVFYVATASGGLFKTVNNGVTFEAQFQFEDSISIGDVCVAPSNPDIVWVGTGEQNGRNSVSWGNGVYKSTDGGKTWNNMGLKKSFQVGRMAIHPKNPDIVYVGTLGRLWGQNEERGVYKTIDGGKTWERILFVDDATGCIDLVLSPADPNTILAAMYERQRDAFDGGDPVKKWGWGSGLFKSTDAGKSWKRVTNGLPSVKVGRIGVSYLKSNPKVVFAIVDSEKIGSAPKGTKQPALMGISGGVGGTSTLARITPGGPAEKAGLQDGDTILAVADKKVESYDDLIATIRAHSAGDTVEVKAKRGDKTVKVKLTYASRGGSGGFSARLGGQAANSQDKQGPEGFQCGGIYKSVDGGETWKRINSLNPRPFYFSQIRVDPNDEKILFVLGINLWQSTDGGKTFQAKSRNGTHADHHAMWIDPRDGRHIILGCDGGLNLTYDRGRTWDFLNNMAIGQFYHVGVDTKAPYNVYGGLQDNGSWGGPSRLRGSQGPTVDEWFVIGGGDGFICLADPNDPDVVYYESQYGNMGRINLKTGDRARMRPPRVPNQSTRFNWKTPFLLSHHNSRIFYCTGNRVFKSLDRGTNLRAISPDLTTSKQGTGTALAESPLNADVLYAGTDDGNLWATTDGGSNWQKLKIDGISGKGRVNTIETSRFKEGRAYVVFDAHYYDDDNPYVFVTEDFGKTWKSLRANLPTGTTRVLREDIENENLLYLGTEFAIYASIDRGNDWTRLNNNLPHVAIHEIAIHPTAGEIVAATHGRSLWILDVTSLRQTTTEVLAKKSHFYDPKTAVLWQGATGKRFYGHKRFIGQNPTSGGVMYYSLKEKAKRVTVTITDIENNTISQLQGPTNAGLNRVVWDLRRRSRRPSSGRRGPGSQTGRPGSQAGRPGQSQATGRGGQTQRPGRPTSGQPTGQRPPTTGSTSQITRTQPGASGQAGRTRPTTGRSSQSRRSSFGGRVAAGTYLVTLDVDGEKLVQKVSVAGDPEFSSTSITFEEEERLRKLNKLVDD